MEKEIVVPKYVFANSEEESHLPPVKRKVFKTMEVTEEFTVYSVFQHVAKMKKAIADKRAEADGLEQMLEAYLREVAIIESQLNITDLEDEFRKLAAEEASKDVKEDTQTDKISPTQS